MRREIGIKEASEDFAVFGIKAQILGIFFYVIKNKRVFEVFLSIKYIIQAHLRGLYNPKFLCGDHDFEEIFIIFKSRGGDTIVARDDSVYRRDGFLVAGEYGKPGARFLIRMGGAEALCVPYVNEPAVKHIHALHHLGENRFLVTTGDCRKAADLVDIDEGGIRRVKRLMRYRGGFTAITSHCGQIWVGSDLSERANFIAVLDGAKYFLPRESVKEYVVSMESLSNTKIEVITRRLGKYSGHRIIFCTEVNKFIASNSIKIEERYFYCDV